MAWALCRRRRASPSSPSTPSSNRLRHRSKPGCLHPWDRYHLQQHRAGFNPLTEAVTLQIGTFAVTIPPGSFRRTTDGTVIFTGVINGVRLEAVIKPTGTLRYLVPGEGKGANLAGTKNAVYATLTIGGDSGATSVTAAISPKNAGLPPIARTGSALSGERKGSTARVKPAVWKIMPE